MIIVLFAIQIEVPLDGVVDWGGVFFFAMRIISKKMVQNDMVTIFQVANCYIGGL